MAGDRQQHLVERRRSFGEQIAVGDPEDGPRRTFEGASEVMQNRARVTAWPVEGIHAIEQGQPTGAVDIKPMSIDAQRAHGGIAGQWPIQREVCDHGLAGRRTGFRDGTQRERRIEHANLLGCGMYGITDQPVACVEVECVANVPGCIHLDTDISDPKCVGTVLRVRVGLQAQQHAAGIFRLKVVSDASAVFWGSVFPVTEVTGEEDIFLPLRCEWDELFPARSIQFMPFDHQLRRLLVTLGAETGDGPSRRQFLRHRWRKEVGPALQIGGLKFPS